MKYKINHNFSNELGQFISHWGEEAQKDMAVEEMSELIKEICKEKRAKAKGEDNTKNLIEETADVLLMALEMAEMLNYNKVMQVVNQKMTRTMKRLADSKAREADKRNKNNNVLYLHKTDNVFFDDASAKIREGIAQHTANIQNLIGGDKIIRDGKVLPMPADAQEQLRQAKEAILRMNTPLSSLHRPVEGAENDSTMFVKYRRKSENTFEAFRFGIDNPPIHWFQDKRAYTNFMNLLKRGDYHGYYIVKNSADGDIVRNYSTRMSWGFSPEEFTEWFVPCRTEMEPTEVMA